MADNSLGRTKKYIEISGRPGPASFISSMFSGSMDYYNLTWSIESIPPLDEIRLLYRRLWVSVVLRYLFKRPYRHFFNNDKQSSSMNCATCMSLRAFADKRDVPASGKMAGYHTKAKFAASGQQQLHHVVRDPRLGTVFGLRSHRTGKESLRLE